MEKKSPYSLLKFLIQKGGVIYQKIEKNQEISNMLFMVSVIPTVQLHFGFFWQTCKKKMIPLHCPLELDFTCEVGHHKCGRYESCVCPCSYHNPMALFILFYFVLFY